jgi:hypothetical protein
MRKVHVSILTVVICALVAAPAFAQQPSKVGLTLGYPQSVGLVIPVTDNVTLRPEMAFSRSSTEFEGPFVIDDSRTSTTFGAGISALFYVSSWNDLRAYVSPRFLYSRASSDDDAKGTAYSVTGSFGAQYSLSDRFAVFGEVGLGWSRSESESFSSVTTIRATNRTTTWSTRSALGAAIYF